MKKLLPFVLIFIVANCSAQFNKGEILLGGGLLVNTSNQQQDFLDVVQKNQFYSFSPSLQFVLNKNTILGFGLAGSYTRQSYSDSLNNSKLNQYGIGVNAFVQKQKWMGDKWFVFANISPSVNYQWNEHKQDNTKPKLLTAVISLSPGVGYRITQKLVADIYLNQLVGATYTWQQYNEPSNSQRAKTTSFSFNSNLNQYLLNNLGITFRWLIKSKGAI